MKPSLALRCLEGAKHGPTREALEIAAGISPERTPVSARPTVSIRVPKQKKVPQTEIEYEAILRGEFPGCKVIHEGIAFRLPSGSRYLPDFTVWSADRLRLIVETKGPKRLLSAARSHEAFKTLIRQFPDVCHRFAQKQESGQWVTEDFNRKEGGL